MRKFAPLLASLVLGLATAAQAAAPTAANPNAAVVAPIKAFIAAFNKGDLKGAAATMTPTVTIVDEVPPYTWTGAGSFDAWLKDLDADDKAQGNTDGQVSLGRVLDVNVAGDKAFAVVQATYRFKRKGQPMVETANFTATLQKGAPGWLIASWTWAGVAAKPDAGK